VYGEFMRESVSSQTRALGWLSLGAAISVGGLILLWLARQSPGVCLLIFPGTCDSDPKLVPATISGLAVLASFGLLIVVVSIARFGHRRRTLMLLCALIGVVSVVGALWTFVTGGFAIEFG
jgi:hypothetical protein